VQATELVASTASETTNCHIMPTTMSIQCTSPGWSDVCGMMAGPTTQASSAMGTVTEAQMARILIKEYCFALRGRRAAPATTGYLSCPQRREKGGLRTSTAGLEIVRRVRRTGDRPYACRRCAASCVAVPCRMAMNPAVSRRIVDALVALAFWPSAG
jgi:hypothetical protein